MKKDIECEERMMIDEKQYLSFMNEYSAYKNSSITNQINYYFDDEDLSLRNHHQVLRIRMKDNSHYELTMKIKGDNGDIELNNYLEEKDAYEMIRTLNFHNDVIENEIKKVTAKPLILITSLSTKRLEVEFDSHLLVIDKNEYSSIIDYDIEVEAKSMEEAQKWIMYYASKFSCEYKKHYVSKSRRAINKALGID